MTTTISTPPNVKLLSLGDKQTGKSCLIKRYCEKRFVSKYQMTIGIDYGTTLVNSTTKSKPLKLHIFDTGGHACFSQIRKDFYENCQAILLTFNMNDSKTFENLKNYWYEELKHNLGTQFDIDSLVIVVCGTHSDSNTFEVKSDEAKLWVESKRGWKYFETSAQNGENVAEVFEYIFSELLNMHENDGRRIIEEKTGFSDEQIEAVERILKGKDNWHKFNLHPNNATKDDVKKQYKHYAKLIHPDKCTVPGHEEAFKEIVMIRNALLKSVKK